MITPHDDALVISAQFGSMELRRILVDNRSSVVILYGHVHNRLDMGGWKVELCDEHPLYAFDNVVVPITGTIDLPIIFGTPPKQTSIMGSMKYM